MPGEFSTDVRVGLAWRAVGLTQGEEAALIPKGFICWVGVVWRKMPKERHTKSLWRDRRCFLGRRCVLSRPPAGTRSHRVKLWQLKCMLKIRRTLSECGVICVIHGLVSICIEVPVPGRGGLGAQLLKWTR